MRADPLLPDTHLRVNATTKSLQISVRLAPSIFIDDIC